MTNSLGKAIALYRQNLAYARRLWALSGSKTLTQTLRELTITFGFSVGRGELILLDGSWYVTHAGLLRLARRHRCSGIRTEPLREFCDQDAGRWVFKATVYKSIRSRGFVGYGDADPSNISRIVRGAELRVAETRAVNRALRKAYGIGLCSVEELGWAPLSLDTSRETSQASPPRPIPSGNGQPRLRDRLCQLLRQHRLDPLLVKRYAAEFCGTESLREASREQVEAFIANLAEWAARDRQGLLCHLNRYAQPQEAQP